jgi:tRNA A-37 threonylcarbamoyl transferase component Bud32
MVETLRWYSSADLGSSPATSRAHRARFQNVGRYTMLTQIAGGGMGSVHVAVMQGSAGFSRLVAIKCLQTRWLDDRKLVARFKSEIELSAKVRHPNVVPTLDVVEQGGELFLVMDYVDGVTLAAFLSDLSAAGRQLPVDLVASVIMPVLRGLQAAHESLDDEGRPLAIVHRDVSPQNIMLGRTGHVQLLDFGLAKALHHTQHTALGTVPGKLAYTAPELVHGEQSSPCTDVFAAGVVLWETLVGRRLFNRPGLSDAELLQALLSKPMPRAKQLRADVPQALDNVVAKALERDPRQRFQSAVELSAALEAAVSPAPPATLGYLLDQVCASRLAEKDDVVRRARAALAAAFCGPEEATELQGHALMVRSFTPPLAPVSGVPAPTPRRWLAAGAVLLLAGLWSSAAPDGASQKVERVEAVLAVRAAPVATAAVTEAPVAPAAVAAAPIATAVVPPDARMTQPPGAVLPLPGSASSGPSLPVGLEADERSPARLDRRPPRSFEDHRDFQSRDFQSRDFQSRAPHPKRLMDCDPPTYMDADGIRHFKKNCI